MKAIDIHLNLLVEDGEHDFDCAYNINPQEGTTMSAKDIKDISHPTAKYLLDWFGKYKSVKSLLRYKNKTEIKYALQVKYRYSMKKAADSWYVRKSMSEADRFSRRMKKDLKFRKQTIVAYCKEFKKLQPVYFKTCKEAVDYNILSLTPNHKDRIARLRLDIKEYAWTIAQKKLCDKKFENNICKIPMNVTFAKIMFPMIWKNHNVVPSVHVWGRTYRHKNGVTCWHNWRPVGYTAAVNDHEITSVAVIMDDGKKIAYDFGGGKIFGELIAPEGYLWGKDEYGLKLYDAVRQAMDYHPDATDIQCGVTHIIEKLETNRRIREEQLAQELAKKAELEGVYVCFKDSLRAGNCLEGTASWVASNGLDKTKHYPAQVFYEKAKNEQRVKIALQAAVLRHKKELEKGYADLADHLLETL